MPVSSERKKPPGPAVFFMDCGDAGESRTRLAQRCFAKCAGFAKPAHMSRLPLVSDVSDVSIDEISPSWKVQLQHAIRDPADLERIFQLTDGERDALRHLSQRGGLPLGITPHFLAQMDVNDPLDPLRVQVVPSAKESEEDDWQRRDPLGEEDHEVVPNLVHRYPDRVLLLVTDRCASYCRFCTRKRLVGQGPTPTLGDLESALTYIHAHDEIHEVILSGGDALMLTDAKLDRILSRLRQIPHVEIIRLATRMLAFVPDRITSSLLEVIRAHQPVYVLSHFNHPRELSPEAAAAVLRLVDAGVPVLNQTVLLRDVNDDEDTLRTLFRHLTRLRARPYYLHQCDLAPGTRDFRVPLARAMEIVGNLRGHLSGLSMPQLVVDIPGGLGKVPMFPNPVVEDNANSVVLQGFRKQRAHYPKR